MEEGALAALLAAALLHYLIEPPHPAMNRLATRAGMRSARPSWRRMDTNSLVNGASMKARQVTLRSVRGIGLGDLDDLRNDC